MTIELHHAAVWDDTPKQYDGVGPIQVGRASVCSIIIDGIEWRSWLPKSREEADKINAVAQSLLDIDRFDLFK